MNLEIKTKIDTSPINQAFNYVIFACDLFKIDESHALKHSIEVYQIANKIYDYELKKNPESELKHQKEIIGICAILHDMCDKKYMDETVGMNSIKTNLTPFISNSDMTIIESIITTMSYSKVKINGFPDLGKYQLAYHIVREADLLAAYDIDRCIIFGMYAYKISYASSLEKAIVLFKDRVLKYRRDKLFVTAYGKKKSQILHKKSKNEVHSLSKQLRLIQYSSDK